MSPLEESLQKLQMEYTEICAKIGSLTVQIVHHEKEIEKLKIEATSMIRRINTLHANQPKKEIKDVDTGNTEPSPSHIEESASETTTAQSFDSAPSHTHGAA